MKSPDGLGDSRMGHVTVEHAGFAVQVAFEAAPGGYQWSTHFVRHGEVLHLEGLVRFDQVDGRAPEEAIREYVAFEIDGLAR